MRIASVAKAFSGAVALSLVDRGKLSLDDTIGEVLPSLPAAWAQVTLRQALNHTGGLPDYIKSQAFLDEFIANPRRHFSPQDLIGFVADQGLEFPPGSRYEYSDTDNIVIGLMAEAATGRSYERLLRTLVYKPLGMMQTSLPSGFRMPTPFIHGYDVSEPGPPQDVSEALSMSGPWASGGIESTPADLDRFIRAYGSGSLFGKPVRRQQFQFIQGGQSQPVGPGRNSAGLAIFRYQTRCGTVFGASGNIPGYTQFTATTRNGRRSVTVSANTQLNSTSDARAAFAQLRKVNRLAVCAALVSPR
jgi:D-alanyl-D-alanine carboxypeptidase